MVAEANVPFVAPPGRPFEQALETLVKNADLRHQIGIKNASRAAELFDEKMMAARYAELIG
jgi:glycosyltransferase involved in cell wall biosynthesis